MTLALTAALAVAMVGTSFISGIFGMAGGMILIGLLLVVLPLPTAMALHAVTQMASNGWRAILWRDHVRWGAVGNYLLGCLVALAVWSLTRYVPSTPVALLLLGATPFLARMAPARLKPNPASLLNGASYGCVCMTLLLLTGVTGPLIDHYFLGSLLDRRQVVATKAVCQVFGHGLKLFYFGVLIDQGVRLDALLVCIAVAASMLGTTLARQVLEGMSDQQFRLWTNRIITAVAGFYAARGSWLLLVG